MASPKQLPPTSVSSRISVVSVPDGSTTNLDKGIYDYASVPSLTSNETLNAGSGEGDYLCGSGSDTFSGADGSNVYFVRIWAYAIQAAGAAPRLGFTDGFSFDPDESAGDTAVGTSYGWVHRDYDLVANYGGFYSFSSLSGGPPKGFKYDVRCYNHGVVGTFTMAAMFIEFADSLGFPAAGGSVVPKIMNNHRRRRVRA